MAETAAHLGDHVFPPLAVRQWVLFVPKRLRYFLQRDGAALNTALRIFLRVIQHSLHEHCAGAAQTDPATLRIGAVAFVYRFGASLNTHVHFYVCVVDGAFEAVAGDANADPAIPPGVIFHPASGLDKIAVAQVQADVRRRILRAFVGRGLIESFDAKAMPAYTHSGFSVDAGVCIEATDHTGLERLLRYCARAPFTMDRLRKQGADLVYHCPKPQSGGKQADLVLTPLELIARIAALVPPSRTHRHRYFGVLAPNSPLRAAVTAMAQVEPVHARDPAPPEQAVQSVAAGIVPGAAQPPAPESAKRSPAHYLWAMLIARIFLDHIGVDAQAPRITPARGPPLWDDCDAQAGEGVDAVPALDLGVQAAPDYQVDQRTNW